MAAECELRLTGSISGIEAEDLFHFLSDINGTPTKRIDTIQVQATADTAEALNLGNISTPMMVLVYAVENDVDVDLTYDTTFHAELSISEGEFNIFKPKGTVYIKNATASETATVEIIACGT